MMEHEYFECACMSDEHRLVFIYDEVGNDLYISVFLDNRSFLQRLWCGIKYIFGYKSMYGHFDCFLMHPKDYSRMRELFEKLEKLQT